jgi:hypothetical protein
MKTFKVKNVSKFPVRILYRFQAIPAGKEVDYVVEEDNEERALYDLRVLQNLGYIKYQEVKEVKDVVAPEKSPVPIEEPAEVVKEREENLEKAPSEQVEYSDNMTKADLVALAEKHGVDINSSDTKKEIIEKLDAFFGKTQDK